MMLIRPVLQDDRFVADVGGACGDARVLHIWWLGQSGFLLKWLDHCLLLDPYLSDSLTTKHAATDKPHIRITARVVDPVRLDFVNVVTSSHNHTDHLDESNTRTLTCREEGVARADSRLNLDGESGHGGWTFLFLALQEGCAFRAPFDDHTFCAALHDRGHPFAKSASPVQTCNSC